MVLDSSDDYVSEELVKQKRRLKEISSALETQQLLLRLIVQVCILTPIMISHILYVALAVL
jgi:hypothetical protein